MSEGWHPRLGDRVIVCREFHWYGDHILAGTTGRICRMYDEGRDLELFQVEDDSGREFFVYGPAKANCEVELLEPLNEWEDELELA